MAGRLEKSLHYLSWHYVIKAVLEVFHENERAEESGRPDVIKASADVWASNDRLRREIHERAEKIWCGLTGMDHTYFPYSVDGIARFYYRIRKRTQAEVKTFDREVDEAFGVDHASGLFPDD